MSEIRTFRFPTIHSFADSLTPVSPSLSAKSPVGHDNRLEPTRGLGLQKVLLALLLGTVLT